MTEAHDLSAHFDRLMERLFPPERIRSIDAGAPWGAQMAEVTESGFLNSLATEANGGAGLSLAAVLPMWIGLGRHAAPLALGEAMIDRAAPDEGQAAAARILLLAAALAGAADTVLRMTVAYANDRVQFGKPIGRQQALQQQMAVMAEDCVAMRIAVEQAAGRGQWPDPLRAAVAKTIAAAAAPRIANTAHAVHGAIGISAEHDLQLFTRRLHEWRLDGGSETMWNRAIGRAVLDSPLDMLGFVRATLADG
jgi:alkylation response protein AidB-like acyl-CoA dehydrogenase